MAATLPPTTEAIEELRRQIGELRKAVNSPNSSALPSWLSPLLQGVTILTIAAGGFWLGSVNRSVTQTSDRVDKIYTILVESKDSLAARTSVSEARLESIDKKLDQLSTSSKK